MTFNDTPDANDIRKRMIEDEMIYLREECLGILGVHQGQEPTPEQLEIVERERVVFEVEVKRKGEV